MASTDILCDLQVRIQAFFLRDSHWSDFAVVPNCTYIADCSNNVELGIVVFFVLKTRWLSPCTRRENVDREFRVEFV